MLRRARLRRFRSVGEVLPKVLAKFDLEKVVAGQKAVEAWPGVVGEQIARHARAVGFEQGKLLVVVDNPGWMTQLKYLKPKLIAKLAGLARKGVVSDIRFMLSREG